MGGGADGSENGRRKGGADLEPGRDAVRRGGETRGLLSLASGDGRVADEPEQGRELGRQEFPKEQGRELGRQELDRQEL